MIDVYDLHSPPWLIDLIDAFAEELPPANIQRLKGEVGKALIRASEGTIEKWRHRVCCLRLERLLDALQGQELAFISVLKTCKELHTKEINNLQVWQLVHQRLSLQFYSDCNKLKIGERYKAKAALMSAYYTQSSMSESANLYCMFAKALHQNPEVGWQLGWNEEVQALKQTMKEIK